MALKSSKYRIPKLKLRSHYEYVEVKRASTGAANDFGEPSITWSSQYNVKASITPSDYLTGEQLAMLPQGMVEISTHYGLFEGGANIRVRDKVVNADSETYDVIVTKDYVTHTDVLLRILEEDS